MVFESEIAWAILYPSSTSFSGPVATGFSTKRGTPGKWWRICISISRPARVVPRNMGGLPTTNARGLSFAETWATNSSNVLNTRVFSYAGRTNELHFFWRTAAALSIAGSIKATTLSRRPSLLCGSSRRGLARGNRILAVQAEKNGSRVLQGNLDGQIQ